MNLACRVLGVLFLGTTLVFSQTSLSVEVAGDQLYCGENAMPILTEVNLSGAGTLPVIYVQIVSGYTPNKDLLLLSGNHPNITSDWSPTEGRLSLVGPASISEFEEALRAVRYRTSQVFFDKDKTFTVNLGEASYLPSTGHYYIYVSDVGINWFNARDNAEEMEYFGLQGYLVTVTSEDEVELTGEQSLGTGWIGASDAQTEGIWRWVTGPESGDVFWEGGVSGNAPDGAFAYWNTGEPNNFGDEHYAHITDPEVGSLGSWNDLKFTGDPPGPYHPQGYMVEFGGMPGDPDIKVSGSTIIRTPRFEYTVNSICDSGVANIQVETNTDSVTWFASPSSTDVLGTGTEFTQSVNTTTTFWASALFNGCNGGPRVPVEVEVFSNPITNNISIVQCDDEVQDGLTLFNINNYRDAILQGTSEDEMSVVELSYYNNPFLVGPVDGDAYTNQSNYQTLYVLAENSVTGCQSSSEVLLIVNSSENNNYGLELCDDFIEDGFTFFDLNEATTQILPNAPTNATVNYFRTYNDALLEVNQLEENYFNEEPYYQEIFARISTNNGDCHAIDTVVLQVNALPDIGADFEVVYYCLETYPQPIIISGAVTNDVPNNYYYNWSTGETTIEIEVNEVGNYDVLVTEVDGCTNLKTIRVEASEMAQIQEVQVLPAGDLNTLIVEVSGSGSYEYALDSEFGPYQESNVFENVAPGIKTVYIKDAKGNCTMAVEEVSVIGYPKFFTPNGDGVNDSWGLKGFNTRQPFVGTIRIFNRFGKLLAVLDASKSIWDGTYNGTQLPASDYWFIAELEEGRVITGHFALKR